MKNKIIFSFIIILTLFLAISIVSANENATDVVSIEDNSSVTLSQSSPEDTHDSDLSQNEVYVKSSSTDSQNISDAKSNNETRAVSKISASDVVSYTDVKKKFTVKLTSGKAKLANKKVKIVLNGKTYKKTTNSKGQVAINFKLKTGHYNVKYSFAGDKKYAPSKGTAKITVKSNLVTGFKLVDKYITYREGLKSIFQVKLIDIHHKTVNGKRILINVSGKKYAAKTNSKGIATVYLKLKEGKHKVNCSFSKSGKYLSSSKTFKLSVKSKMAKGNGYWVNKWDMNKVNLKKLSKLGTKHIFLLHTSFDMYGEAKVLKWIKKAHKYGMKVHMWISVFYKNGKYLHPSSKNGAYNYKQMSKIIKKVKHYSRLKGVDGIHFDYLRFGGNAYKYKNAVKAVNFFVKTACKQVRSINPDIILSAAVMPEPTSMKYYYAQDIPTISKYLDVVVPMIYKGNYHASSKWIKKTTKQFKKKTNSAQIWSGLQSYKSDSNIKKLSYSALFKDAKNAKKGGASGIVLFRWGLSALLNFNKI